MLFAYTHKDTVVVGFRGSCPIAVLMWLMGEVGAQGPAQAYACMHFSCSQPQNNVASKPCLLLHVIVLPVHARTGRASHGDSSFARRPYGEHGAVLGLRVARMDCGKLLRVGAGRWGCSFQAFNWNVGLLTPAATKLRHISLVLSHTQISQQGQCKTPYAVPSQLSTGCEFIQIWAE